MPPLEGQNTCHCTKFSSANATDDARNVSTITRELSPAQDELIDLVSLFGPLELAADCMSIHDMALYHSDMVVDTEEKSALYHLKHLADVLREIGRET